MVSAKLRTRFAVVALFLLAVLWPEGRVSAQAEPDTAQKLFLRARNRQIDLRSAQEELARAQQLFSQGLISSIEVEKARTGFEKTQLAYQEALLDLLNIQPRLTIREAVKYQGPHGEKLIRLTVENLTSGLQGSELEILRSFQESVRLPQALETRTVNDVLISLKDSGAASAGNPAPMRGATVALPYEQYIPSISYGVSKTLVFQLLRDVSSVLVRMSFAGTVQEIDIHLQHAESDQVSTLTSTQASQEADLGSEAAYDLRLSRATVDERSFSLSVLGLPRQIDFSFVDPVTGARLSQINFPAGVTERGLSLRIFLPDRADQQVRLDQPLRFWVVVGSGNIDPSQLASAADAASQGAGVLRLALIPRGVGRIEMSAPSLFSEIRAGESLSARVVVKNTGSRRVDNTRLVGEPPLGWRLNVRPPILASLQPGEEKALQVTISPSPEVVVGDYEVALRPESTAFNRPVRAQEKIYRISVRPRPRILMSALLVSLFLTLVVGMVVFGIRMARR